MLSVMKPANKAILFILINVEWNGTSQLTEAIQESTTMFPKYDNSCTYVIMPSVMKPAFQAMLFILINVEYNGTSQLTEDSQELKKCF